MSSYIRIRLPDGSPLDASFLEFVGATVEQIEGSFGVRITCDEETPTPSASRSRSRSRSREQEAM
jgi:hypothetical protein